jgi:DNA polymerase-4
MDAFYASVEQRDDPALRGRPVIVGGHPSRGVVLAASYEVRPAGVRSAMPMARALRLAPHAVVVPPRFPAYVEASGRVFALFERITPLIEPLSLDEAFLDVTGSQGLFGPPARIAADLRARIAAEVGLPSSAGIASCKFVAKLASDLAKPNGQMEVPEGETVAFLADLPVSRLWGVGARTEQVLRDLGLYRIGQIAAREPDFLERHLGEVGRHLHQLSRGLDDRPVVPDRQAKSIGAEDTFDQDLDDPDALRVHLLSQALRVGARLRRAGLRTRVVQLKLKHADFTLLTRRQTLSTATDDGQVLYEVACQLLRRAWPGPGKAIRLTGVSAQELDEQDGQLSLFEGGQNRRRQRLNAVIDQIAGKFGPQALVPLDLREGPRSLPQAPTSFGEDHGPARRPRGFTEDKVPKPK